MKSKQKTVRKSTSTQNGNTKNIGALHKLVTNYDPITHQNHMLPIGHERYRWHDSFAYLNPKSWKADPAKMPYIAASALLDAYACLPNRPDMAFTSLWSATNSAYNDLYLRFTLSNGATLGDSKSIDLSVKRISQKLGQLVDMDPDSTGNIEQYSIREIISIYFDRIPPKVCHFVARYILKGIAIEKHNEAGKPAIRKILVSSSYSTIKSRFEELHQYLSNSFGKKFFKICDLKESTDRTDVDLGIKKADAGKSRALVHALGVRIVEIIRTNPVLRTETTSKGKTIEFRAFETDEKWFEFLVFAFLYASRNNNVHGNVASRVNSIFADGDTITASTWTFLFGYFYLSLVLLCLETIDYSDLKIHVHNAMLLPE